MLLMVISKKSMGNWLCVEDACFCESQEFVINGAKRGWTFASFLVHAGFLIISRREVQRFFIHHHRSRRCGSMLAVQYRKKLNLPIPQTKLSDVQLETHNSTQMFFRHRKKSFSNDHSIRRAKISRLRENKKFRTRRTFALGFVVFSLLVRFNVWRATRDQFRFHQVCNLAHDSFLLVSNCHIKLFGTVALLYWLRETSELLSVGATWNYISCYQLLNM